MNKRHPHYDMIVAWAEGQPIQVKLRNGIWVGIENPKWGSHSEYRIKPREFEDGAWYPVITSEQRKVICRYVKSGRPFFSGEGVIVYEENIGSSNRWVGEKIEVTWRDD